MQCTQAPWPKRTTGLQAEILRFLVWVGPFEYHVQQQFTLEQTGTRHLERFAITANRYVHFRRRQQEARAKASASRWHTRYTLSKMNAQQCSLSFLVTIPCLVLGFLIMRCTWASSRSLLGMEFAHILFTRMFAVSCCPRGLSPPTSSPSTVSGDNDELKRVPGIVQFLCACLPFPGMKTDFSMSYESLVGGNMRPWPLI